MKKLILAVLVSIITLTTSAQIKTTSHLKRYTASTVVGEDQLSKLTIELVYNDGNFDPYSLKLYFESKKKDYKGGHSNMNPPIVKLRFKDNSELPLKYDATTALGKKCEYYFLIKLKGPEFEKLIENPLKDFNLFDQYTTAMAKYKLKKQSTLLQDLVAAIKAELKKPEVLLMTLKPKTGVKYYSHKDEYDDFSQLYESDQEKYQKFKNGIQEVRIYSKHTEIVTGDGETIVSKVYDRTGWSTMSEKQKEIIGNNKFSVGREARFPGLNLDIFVAEKDAKKYCFIGGQWKGVFFEL